MKQTVQIKIEWKFKAFSELTNIELYTILAERQRIFVVEQNCAFQEADYLDEKSWHLMGYMDRQLAAYARIVFPGEKFNGPSIGRIITTQKVRGTGIGKLLLKEAIRQTEKLYPGIDIHLSAQQHLESFYELFGFEQYSEPYDEDGIMHIDMKTTNGKHDE